MACIAVGHRATIGYKSHRTAYHTRSLRGYFTILRRIRLSIYLHDTRAPGCTPVRQADWTYVDVEKFIFHSIYKCTDFLACDTRPIIIKY